MTCTTESLLMYITLQHDVTHVRYERTLCQACISLCNIVQRKITCIIIESNLCNMCIYVTLYIYVRNNQDSMLHNVALCSLTCTWRNNVDQHVHIRWHCVLTCSSVVFLSNNIVKHVTIMYILLQHYDNNHHDMVIRAYMCTSIANMSWHCYNFAWAAHIITSLYNNQITYYNNVQHVSPRYNICTHRCNMMQHVSMYVHNNLTSLYMCTWMYNSAQWQVRLMINVRVMHNMYAHDILYVVTLCHIWILEHYMM